MKPSRFMGSASSALIATLALLGAHDADAACFDTANSAKPWNGQYVYQFDSSALQSAVSVAQGCGWQVPDPQNYGNITIKDLFLQGLADWLQDQSFPVGLQGEEYTGGQPKRIVVTAWCEVDGKGNYAMQNEDVDGYGWVPHINLRPTNTHTRSYFNRTVRHEIGHSLGFQHMHQRWDAADYLTVKPANIPPQDPVSAYQPKTFADCNSLNLMLPFDYSSIMIYPPNVKPTCKNTESNGCDISPGSSHPQDPDYNPNYTSDFNMMTGALSISFLDRIALQLYYPPVHPDTIAFFNPHARLWSFLAENDGIIASEFVDAKLRAFSSGNYYRTPYGDGDTSNSHPDARPLVAPWGGGSPPYDKLGEVYHGPEGRDPFYYHGDADGDIDASTDTLKQLQIYSSAKFVTVDTVNGVLIVAYVPSVDRVYTDADADGVPDAPYKIGGVSTIDASNEPFSGDFYGNGTRLLAVREQVSGYVAVDLDGDLDFDMWAAPFMPGTTLRPFAGDWRGTGRDMLGLYDPTTRMVYLDRDGTFHPDLNTSWSPDVAFLFESAPIAGDALLWPASGHFVPGTIQTDMPQNHVPDPWKVPICETMSDNQSYCPEAWEWCFDLYGASDGCFPVICEDSRTVTRWGYPYPDGCGWYEDPNTWEIKFECNIDPNTCLPP